MNFYSRRTSIVGTVVLLLIFFFSIPILTLPSSLHAEEDLSMETISKIRVVGNSRIPTSSISYYLESKENDPFDKKLLREDIKRLYKLDHFENINAEVNKVKEGVEIVLNVREKPSVNSVKISGNKHISTADIAKRVTIKKGMIFKPSIMVKNAERIKLYYRGEGYYFADVKASYKETLDGKVTVKYFIDEGPKTLISSIKFVGNEHVSDDEFLKFMKTREEMFVLSWFSDRGVFKENDFKRDLQVIQAIMQNFGYLKAKVEKYTIDADKTTRQVHIVIYVEEGAVYTVKNVLVQGDDIYPTEELQESLTSKAGERYNRDFIGQDIVTLSNKYSEKGFAFVDVIPDIKENDGDKTVDISYTIDRGDRAYIGNISITGNETTRDYVIRRELRFQENQILDTVSLDKSKKRLDNLDFFESVKMNYAKNKDGLMDMTIEVIEKPTNTFTVGAGYSQAESLIFTTNINMKNFLGRGQKLTVGMDLSSIRRNFNLGFVEPWFMNRELSLGANLYNNSVDYITFLTDTLGASASLGKAIDDESYLSFVYQFEQIKTSQVQPADVTAFLYNGTSISSSITGNYLKDTRDDRRKPTDGYKFVANAQLAGLTGDKYYKLNASAGYYYPIFHNFIGHVRAAAGYGNAYSGDIMKSYARYVGDANMLRGYKTSEIGPKDGTGGIVGGTSQLYLNVELHYIINEYLRPYAFYDRGNVYGEAADLTNTARNISLSQMRQSWGLGLMIDTPMGPLSFSYGFKISPAPGDTPSQFNFGLGGSF